MDDLWDLGEAVGAQLKARGETVAVAESSGGGLVSAALLAVAGASAYYLGGAVVYTGKARMVLMELPREAVAGMRSAIGDCVGAAGRRAMTAAAARSSSCRFRFFSSSFCAPAFSRRSRQSI